MINDSFKTEVLLLIAYFYKTATDVTNRVLP